MENPAKTKRVLITGASEGIGRAFAHAFARRGFAVTAVARNEARLASLLAELPGGGHRSIVADLRDPAGLASVVKDLTMGERYGVLVNNAGYGRVGHFLDGTVESHRAMIALNITALVDLSHAFLARAERGDGLIQLSSTLSFLPMPNQTVYSATKAFVTSFSESLWYQCRPRGIRVLNLCPGATKTLFPTRSGGDAETIPNFVTETPEAVVEAALDAYFAGRGPTLVSGWINRVFLLALRFVSRRGLLEIMGRVRQ